jgi:cytochrome c
VLHKAHDEGIRWDTERLETFLADPAAMFPGLWMPSADRWCAF